MKKTKIVAVMLMMVALATIPASKTQAAWKGWAEYFSQDEGKAIKKMVDSYIRESIEGNDKRWRDIISGSNLKDGEIDSEKVDNSITKRKVYTGTVACDAGIADATNGGYYYKKIAIPEVKLADMPGVAMLSKDNGQLTFLGSNVWSPYSVSFTEGYVWAIYGEGSPISCLNEFSDYKITVNY